MRRPYLFFYAIFAPTVAGVGVVVALVAGYDSLAPLLGAAGVGLVLAVPITVVAVRAMTGRDPRR